MNIYELTEQYLQLQMLLEDAEADAQTVADTLEAIDGEIEAKADGYAMIIRNMEGSLTAIKAEQERLTAKKTVLETGILRLKKNLEEAMRKTGKTKFKTELFSFGIQKNGGKAPVILDVKDTSELPDELVRIKEEPDIEAIRALLEKDPETGKKYAHIGERGESLRIK